jgi:hypothetical protein
MKCPKCGEEMEHGFVTITATRDIRNIEWYEKKLEMSFNPPSIKREILFDPSSRWMAQVEGFRCISDRLVVMEYDNIYYPLSGRSTGKSSDSPD